ncbi:hypothetical protein GSY74_03765 [Sulfurovum sp. bin170]|uniref:hypothetical protein n=1 Tax=Sulfurovum sp. bin170 TaxID=2695268 RepID=UPI0013E05627|nr:hypothetical protein [Sulfurovum sp. bin170]NEW60389.1 hypothetical protein [Sulfurovum sp. bin170]
MSGTVTQIDKMRLDGTTDGSITISIVEQPYGAKSDAIASIGISLKADATEPEWKVHLPKANIDQIISALQEAKKAL